ncbi:tubulin--tyrosine ligase-like protein 12 [Amphiura filiformis]|uniref:tubulin--tyrosine ligase-like protein 12 n=1 Tax=Amphiura filiformis TaxID=82378 RepID=UPI003B21953B
MSSANVENGNHVLQRETEFQQFLKVHQPQLQGSGVPEWLWETLFYKLKNEMYDAGSVFMMTYVEADDDDEDGGGENEEKNKDDAGAESNKPPELKVVVVKEEGLRCADPNNIFLIDHAWTFRTSSQARQQLTQIPGLLQRMVALMGLEGSKDDTAKDYIEYALKEMWRFNQTYSVTVQGATAEEKQPFWYVLDEFGSRIRHDDTPSCALVPFLYTGQQIAFSLLFPLHDLEYADEVTRDFAHHTKDPLLRQIHLLPWQPKDLTHLSTDQSEPSEDYMQKVCNETPPGAESKDIVIANKDGQLKVFTPDAQIQENLKHPRFILVPEHEEADILWLKEAWKDFPLLAGSNKYINQFPGEKLIITKDMLAVSGRRKTPANQGSRPGPKWLPVTFNLDQALPQFVSYFQKQQEKGNDNIWILKPFNLARSLDTTVSNNLNQIIRITETNVPKVACEYITDPVLYHRSGIGPVKFDLRFIVLLSSVEPLKLFAYKIFWIRFANKAFSLDHFDDYQKHFTVMNYAEEEEGTDWHQVLWKDFMPAFESQFPGHTWESVESSMHGAIKELFEGAASKPHPYGLTHSPYSRAMYGIDAMLQWQTDEKGDKYMQPMILECNFIPDCERACWHRKEYFDDVFSTLFLDDIKDRPVVLL